MSDLFTRLSDALTAGHAKPIDDLLSDAQFAGDRPVADAAVLIAVVDHASREPGVLLTQRPTTMRDHPGQVAFPGGKRDDGETAEQTALREAEEELAIPPSAVRIVGRTDRYHTGTGFDIAPVVGVVPSGLDIVPEAREVEAWFEPPLARLLDRSGWTTHSVMWRGAERRYLEMHYEGFRIWGVTAAIIANLSRRLATFEL